MLDFSWLELIIVFCGVLFLLMLSCDVIIWFKQSPRVEECSSPIFLFGYATHNGPHTWKFCYRESTGYNQSPINISKKLAITVNECDDIEWENYDLVPDFMIMANDGNSVIVHGNWHWLNHPSIKGGPLTGIYDFHSMMFHWGPSDSEGSEHTIDHVRYAMELQLIHVKRGLASPLDAIYLNARDGVVIVSTIFNIMPSDNPYLDYVVTNLRYIRRHGSKIKIPPFPLSWMRQTDAKGYYAYHGSLTQPPCNEIVTWLVDPAPAAISSNQVAQFRTLCSKDGTLLTNCRPVQYLNGREVYLYM